MEGTQEHEAASAEPATPASTLVKHRERERKRESAALLLWLPIARSWSVEEEQNRLLPWILGLFLSVSRSFGAFETQV